MQETIEAIILRTYPSAEADLVLRVLSSQGIKYSLLAKHARKSRRRFSSSFDLFDRGQFRVRHSASHLAWLESFNAGPCLRSLRESLDKLTLASLLSECFDLLIKEGSDENPNLFRALELSLRSISEAGDLRDQLHAAFVGMATLLKLCGIFAAENDLAASAKNLERLLRTVEEHVEKPLATRAALNVLLEELRSSLAL